MISKLAAVEGDAQAVNARNTLMTLINTANSDMQYLINNLLSSVGEQVSENTQYMCVCVTCRHTNLFTHVIVDDQGYQCTYKDNN